VEAIDHGSAKCIEYFVENGVPLEANDCNVLVERGLIDMSKKVKDKLSNGNKITVT
jgi:hypothetical protein